MYRKAMSDDYYRHNKLAYQCGKLHSNFSLENNLTFLQIHISILKNLIAEFCLLIFNFVTDFMSGNHQQCSLPVLSLPNFSMKVLLAL